MSYGQLKFVKKIIQYHTCFDLRKREDQTDYILLNDFYGQIWKLCVFGFILDMVVPAFSFLD